MAHAQADTTKWLASILKDDLNTSINLEVEGLDEMALRKRVLNLSALLLERNKLEVRCPLAQTACVCCALPRSLCAGFPHAGLHVSVQRALAGQI